MYSWLIRTLILTGKDGWVLFFVKFSGVKNASESILWTLLLTSARKAIHYCDIELCEGSSFM